MALDNYLDDRITELAIDFEGQSPDLINAMGALCFGRVYGWRVLRFCISKGAYYKHQKTLGFKFADHLPELTPLSVCSKEYQKAVDSGRYWDIINGVCSVDPKAKAFISRSNSA